MRSATRSYGVLIDAGHLKRELGTRERPATFEEIDAFLTRLEQSPRLKNLTLYRIYYYDAKPFRDKKLKPLNGGEMDFGATDVAVATKSFMSLCANVLLWPCDSAS